ncbi:hypothetical protein [Jhaorihella thermophila]|uniref:Uncharacterized protein n=1 Tax=Jhaorihella thermophila TaxID=488547 RepID=A0A1H5RRK1_9RHOB|nr:hypothetical protein [Jhaorihella thermophila]SEF40982.1 hypothetical protein SAMN05421751_101121 [Jhaorihella thermophila]
MAETFVKMTMGLGLMVLAATQLRAEGMRDCAPRAQVVERLAAAYGEVPHSIGLTAQGVVVELFASELTGTWTITATRADGRTCLVASGEAFDTIARPAPIPGLDA